MYKINFTGEYDHFKKGISEIKNLIGIEIVNDLTSTNDTPAEKEIAIPDQVGLENIEIKIEKNHEDFLDIACMEAASMNSGGEHGKGSKSMGIIKYTEPVQVYRGLCILINELKRRSTFAIRQKPNFDMNGAMFDMSRGAVMTVSGIKKMLRTMALMGLNTILLYTEDTYTLPPYKYFGYMRGKYSKEELKECDDYAYDLGIEMIPCIQTLGHMKQYLKWAEARPVKDTDSVMLIGEEKTYRLIESMFKEMKDTFRSDKIHIGMDEAFDVGLGEYKARNGERNKFDIMTEHMREVVKIAGACGFSPMAWSDMLFLAAGATISDTGVNVDITFSNEMLGKIPEDLKLVYWDYYSHDINLYKFFINKQRELKREIMFAGGMWTWAGPVPNYPKSIFTTNLALKACKTEGIRKVFVALWGDDGAEADMFMGLGGLQLFAEHGYSKGVNAGKEDIEDINEDYLMQRFRECTGGDLSDVISLSALQLIPGASDLEWQAGFTVPNPVKCILWQDVIFGLFDKNAEDRGLKKYYGELSLKYGDVLNKYLELSKNGYEGVNRNESTNQDEILKNDFQHMFEFAESLAGVLSLKCEAGIMVKKAYDDGDMAEMENLAEGYLPLLKESVENLRRIHRRNWMANYKHNGFEVIDIRYGGVLARIDTLIYRLKEYLACHIDSLPELGEEKLVYPGPGSDDKGWTNSYTAIRSPNSIV